MNKVLLAMASFCIVIVITSSIVNYIYFCDRFNATFESCQLQISELEQQNENLKREVKKLNETYELEISNLEQECEKLRQDNQKLKVEIPYLTEPYLVTSLGWYLHDSSDPVNISRNSLNIYGNIYNVGAKTANNCKLQVKFYDNSTLLQTSIIKLPDFRGWSYTYIGTHRVDCEFADNVTRIEVERFWSGQLSP